MKFSELNTNRNKLYLLGFLLLILIVLFVLYNLKNKENSSQIAALNTSQVKVLSPDELKSAIPRKIDSVASLFAIRKEWIHDISQRNETTKSPKDKKEKPSKTPPPSGMKDVLWFAAEISTPKDVSGAEFNLELKNSLFEIDFDCIGNEDPKTGNVLINIFNKKDSSKKTLGTVNLVFSDNVKREVSDVCLVLNRADELSIPELEKLLALPDKFSVVLPDIVSKIDAQTVVLDSKRDYVLFADIGTEDDLLAEFKVEMPPKVWRSKVRSMCYEYDKAAAVIISNPKKIHPFETDVLNEFRNYNLKAYKDSVFVSFDSKEESEKKVNALFNDIMHRSAKGARSIIYLVNLNNDDMKVFREESFKLKRKGFRFYNFSEIMKRRQKIADTEIKNEVTG